MSNYASGPRFLMGRPLITPSAQTALNAAGIEGVLLLARHIHGDWGHLGTEDLTANELSYGGGEYGQYVGAVDA
ncbi:hypothetical protein LIG30_2843 [Burkholderia sp. lig30]|uniref:hypothetical protein n=1 Tax=Burkholderia sp. lig30 TaxID=1192124 RepID=UPI0004610FAA|nr:hypothetical protein [Burkholderia sp. lig30]KDB08044.1 hypothetical protein LIG30_2843 [Burkholderia sp. lig30]